MSATTQIYHHSDLYEITFRGNTILRIIKFVGDSQFRREVGFDSLPKEVRDKVEEILNGETEDEE